MTNENIPLKEELLEGISELFLTYGLRSTSMDDICTHLKISKKTLYQLFENKDDVVEQVMRYRRELQRKEIDMCRMMDVNPVDILFGIKGHLIEDLSSRLPANFFDMKKYHPEVDKRMMAEDYKFISEMLTVVLSNGIRDGLFRKDLNIEVEIYLFSKQMNFLSEPEAMSVIVYPIPMLISAIIDNFIRAIITEDGLREFEKILGQKEENQ